MAVVVVSHLRKRAGAAIYRAMGSLAFIAAARAGWVLCKDPSGVNKRWLLPFKSNLAPDATGLSFSIETDPTHRVPTIHWSLDAVHVTAESTMGAARLSGRPDDERQFAVDWLRKRLTKGALHASNLKKEADAHGISYGPLRRAFRTLGGVAVREHPFPHAPWHWRLPAIATATIAAATIDAQNTGGEFCAPVEYPDDFIRSLLNNAPFSFRFRSLRRTLTFIIEHRSPPRADAGQLSYND